MQFNSIFRIFRRVFGNLIVPVTHFMVRPALCVQPRFIPGDTDLGAGVALYAHGRGDQRVGCSDQKGVELVLSAVLVGRVTLIHVAVHSQIHFVHLENFKQQQQSILSSLKARKGLQ